MFYILICVVDNNVPIMARKELGYMEKEYDDNYSGEDKIYTYIKSTELFQLE